jgi:ABC-2 type transport system ATP-binding protein
VSITVSNLSKNYGSQKAVNNISFHIGKNEIVGFLGPNGAGKSSTMKMITGFLAADAGNISVCDIPVDINSILSKKKIGYLPESNALYLDMFVREYLYFVGDVYHLSDIKKNVENAIQMVGLTPEAHKKIGQLSKGYKQRVGLAAALVHDPEVLILDEPTSGLDPNQIIEIREVIKKLGQHKTVLLSSHIMQEVEAICDRVIIINKGVIVANDTLSNLQQKSHLQQNILVQFSEEINLMDLQSAVQVIALQPLPNRTFLLETTQPEQLKKQLMAFSLQNNIHIESLQTEANSLESVFKSLTRASIINPISLLPILDKNGSGIDSTVRYFLSLTYFANLF